MTTPALRLWECPNACGEPAKRAPERARSDDWNTYCAACTERTGRLVRRVAPSILKERAQREEKKRAEQKRIRALLARKRWQRKADEAPTIEAGDTLKKDSPAFAQVAASIFEALTWYPWANDTLRAATLEALDKINGSAPGLFPKNAREALQSIRYSKVNDNAPAYNWTEINDALDNEKEIPDRALVRDNLIRRIRKKSRTHRDLQIIADEIESTTYVDTRHDPR